MIFFFPICFHETFYMVQSGNIAHLGEFMPRLFESKTQTNDTYHEKFE